ERRAAEVDNAVVVGQAVAAAVDGFSHDLESTMVAAALALGAVDSPLNQQTTGGYLRALSAEYGVLRALFLVDLDGRVVAADGGTGVGVDLSARPYITALRTGK